MVEYGDVGCDGFDYAEHPRYGRLSFNPEVARYIRWGKVTYHVPRVVSELLEQALASEHGHAGGLDKADLMMELMGWRDANVMGS